MRTTAGSKRLLIPIVIAPLLITGYVSAGKETMPVSADKDSMPECPHDWDFSKIQIKNKKNQLVPLQTLNGPFLSAPQAQTNVPEFNDCQRLVLGKDRAAIYDSLYAVFAHDSLDDSLDITTQLNSGAAFPMVEILSLGGTYSKLRLDPGLSCLFVFKKKNNEWHAKMVAFGSDEQDCHKVRPVRAIASYPELSITRTGLKLKWKELPGVARWEWDIKSNTQVIGFRCLEEWCEVGELGHPPETGPDLTSAMSGIPALAGKPVLRVKGWYDEQRLSPTEQDWWHPGAHPRPVVGTIVPVPGLDQLDATSFTLTWTPIAYVNLSEPSNEYYAAASFAPISAGKITTISLCMEKWVDPLPTGKGCKGITQQLREHATCDTEPGASNIHWWAQTIPADNPHLRFWCIVRRSPPGGVPVPGTARWRWYAEGDETTWGRCGGACCSGH
jgi:hypothetical protein